MRGEAVIWRYGIAGLALGVILALGAGVGTAHNSDNWFSATSSQIWASGNIDMAAGSLPQMPLASIVLSDMNAAGNRWDLAPGAPNWGYFSNSGHHHLILTGGSPFVNDACSSTYALDGHEVWVFGTTEIGLGGATQICRSAGPDTEITRAKVFWRAIDTANDPTWTPATKSTWYTDTKPPGSASDNIYISFVGIMTHELGHVVGYWDNYQGQFGHFLQSYVICDDLPKITSDNTMCGAQPIEAYWAHTHWYLNTLRDHDEHTFGDAYDN